MKFIRWKKKRIGTFMIVLSLFIMLCNVPVTAYATSLDENCFVIEDGVLSFAGNQTASKNYYQKRKTGGTLEAMYLSYGPYSDVSKKEIATMQDFKKYIIYYPKDMEKTSEKFPVVIFSNGTGVPASKYSAVLERLASWGFIVMGTDEENSWNGFSSEMCLRKIEQLNEIERIESWESNPFYQSVDMNNIGVVGHSQGGVGVFNAAVENKSGGKIKTIVSESPTNLPLASALDWNYNPSKICVPALLLSGTGNTDENFVVSGEQLTEIYNAIPDNVLKMKLRRSGADHGDMIDAADGYVTAWLCWQLKGDQLAASAFIGENAEIRVNPLYQDISSNF